ncbi:MAG: hypothetical protein GY925_20490 [Actinomycetia bacterium]|nr:hypothetical protein [Actinomycetes bacterium]
MATSTDQSDQAQFSEQAGRDNPQIRRLRIVASVLAILALTLGAALIATTVADDDNDNDNDHVTGIPDDVIQVIEDFETGFEEHDDELLQSILTEDFSSTSDIYFPDTVKPAYTVGLEARTLVSEARTPEMTDIELSSELLVTGDGPWVVAARETWSFPTRRDEGVRLYVVVDEDGTPKLAGYYFVAVKFDVIPDSGN